MPQKKELLIIGFVWPEPGSSAAGLRMMQLISIFLEDGWHITFACASSESDYAEDLEKLGIKCIQMEINSDSFDDFVSDLSPGMVLFDRFITEEQFGWRVAKQCPEALRVLDTEDLHTLRRVRRRCIEEDAPFNKKRLLASETARREIASILRCDLSLIISEFEMELLKDVFNVQESLLWYLPLFAEPITKETENRWPEFDERRNFMTIGNFSHAPNADAVGYLRDEIWPGIKEKLPEAEMHVYGAYPDERARQWQSSELGFYIQGRVKDAKEAMSSARICLAPLRFGAGLKGKLLEAMQCGTPSVTTFIGAEGINGEFPWPGAIADNCEGFVTAAVDLYRDKTRWEKAQQRGVTIINSLFKRKLFEQPFLDRMRKLSDNLKLHRNQNFIGAMLHHHTMASTEYMSRWIEAKNRKRKK